jgi:hypothetical protein
MNELLAKLGLEDKGAVAQCLWDMNQTFDRSRTDSRPATLSSYQMHRTVSSNRSTLAFDMASFFLGAKLWKDNETLLMN